jgi:nucleotide-binding universal stress UspA family protein
MKILLPVDGSVYTKRMLAYIAAHTELLGPGHEYTAFTAVPLIPGRAASFLDGTTLSAYYKEQAEEVFKPVRAFAAEQGWKFNAVEMHGPASEAIATFARESAPDLIVMGAHGHSALGNMVLGSVATGVLARCSVPVLLIR